MSDESAVLRIKDVTPIGNGIYTIAVKPDVNKKGDIGLLAGNGVTEVKFKISKLMASTPGWKYSFAAEPFCVYQTGDPCLATDNGQPAHGFEVSEVTDKSFLLKIPDLGSSTSYYNYRLFAVRKQGGQSESVTIDPKIKPGGVSLIEKDVTLAPQVVGPSPIELVGASILLVAAAFSTGWIMATGLNKR